MAAPSPAVPSPGAAPAPQLRRVLTIRDLVVYGLVLIQPIAPVGIFGIAAKLSEGHVATTILIAMVAMSLTAYSYGRMAAIYPSAGSAYTYVGHGLGPSAGFFSGWAMFLDYLIIPILNVVYCALTLQRLIPSVPYAVWAVGATLLITVLNLRGIQATARANSILLAVMCVVIAGFVVLAARLIIVQAGWGGLFSTTPFYNPATFKWSTLGAATSLAALTYIGFDGVTTLAEEVKDPKRSVPIATVLVCLLTGAFSVAEVYLAQLVWPDYSTFKDPETAFMDVTRAVGGAPLFQAMGAVLVLACIGSGLSGQASLGRLLFSMGRDGALPRRFFAHVSPGQNIPNYNIVATGAVTLVAALILPYQNAAELLNFGAFLGFMGVNLALIRIGWFRGIPDRPRQFAADFAVPLLGFLFCLVIWLNLATVAKVAGGAWLILGFAYLAIRTRGFRLPVSTFDFDPK